jgi:hypothetical protein
LEQVYTMMHGQKNIKVTIVLFAVLIRGLRFYKLLSLCMNIFVSQNLHSAQKCRPVACSFFQSSLEKKVTDFNPT